MKVNLWEKDNGESPVGVFIEGLPNKTKKKIIWVVELFQEKGMGLIHTKFLEKLKITENIYELKVIFGGNIYRILLVIYDDASWLLHAFHKKTQKTPPEEIKRAIERKKLLEQELGIEF
jgi:phage-related protein